MTFTSYTTSVKLYGARGDGLVHTPDESIAFQQAINSVIANGGGTVFIPAGTYVFNVPSNPLNTFCSLTSGNFAVIGEGDASVIKIGSSLAAGGFNLFSSGLSLLTINNIQFSNFCIDGNSSANPNTNNLNNFLILVQQGSNVVINNCLIKNSSSLNPILIGDPTTANIVVSDINISNNRFENIANDTHLLDHSTLWVSADRAVIHGNVFSSPSGNLTAQTVGAAMELHGQNIVCSSNEMEVYANCFTIGSGALTRNISIVNNVADDVHAFVQLFENPAGTPAGFPKGFTNNIKISNNIAGLKAHLDIPMEAIFIAFIGSSDMSFDNIEISNNTLRIDAPPATASCSIIGLAANFNNLAISNNTLIGPCSAGGIIFSPEQYSSGNNFSNDITITDNTLINCGNASNAAIRLLTITAETTKHNRYIVENNDIVDNRNTPIMARGIEINAAVNGISYINNNIVGFTDRAINVVGGSALTSVKPLNASGSGAPSLTTAHGIVEGSSYLRTDTPNGSLYMFSSGEWEPIGITVDTMAALKTQSNSVSPITVKGFSTIGDGGGGKFVWNSTSTATDDGGTIIQATGVSTGRWLRVYSGPRDVRWFGIKGDGYTNNSTLIQALLDGLPSTGGDIYWAAGDYWFSTPISLTAKTNVRWIGAGGRYYQDFDNAPTRLLFTGTGSSPAFSITTNFARGFIAENMSIEYSSSSFTGSLFYIATQVSFRRCALGGASPVSPAPNTITSAQAVLEYHNCERAQLESCVVQYATRGIWVPSAGAAGFSACSFRDTQFDNVSLASVDIETGGVQNVSFYSCHIDATRVLDGYYGMRINANGVNINGCVFAATTAAHAPGISMTLDGSGTIEGCTILSEHIGLQINSGSWSVNGNYLFGSPAVNILGGTIRGGGNKLAVSGAGTQCYVINPGSADASFNIGPDEFDAGQYSYYIVKSSGVQYGVTGNVFYDPSFDATSSKCFTSDPFVKLQNLRLNPQFLVDAAATTGSSEVTLYSATIPSRSMTWSTGVGGAGKGFRFRAWGTFAANGNNKQVRITYGATVLYDSTSGAYNGSAFTVEGEVLRTGATAQDCFVHGDLNNVPITTTYTSAAETLTNDILFKVLGTGTSNGDVNLRGCSLQPIY